MTQRKWEGTGCNHNHGPIHAIVEARLSTAETWGGLTTKFAMEQQLALLRLHIWTTGTIAIIFNKAATDIAGLISRAAPDDDLTLGQIPGIMVVVDSYLKSWREDFASFVKSVRIVATWIPWGTASKLFGSAISIGIFEEQVGLGYPTWDPNLPNPDGTRGGLSPVFVNYQPVIDAAANRVSQLVTGLGGLRYSDGKNLSDRVWAIPAKMRGRVLSELVTAASKGESAFAAAKRFEQWLAPGQNCPRWSSSRLRLTKSQIAAGDRTGLYSGNPCNMKGTAYAAVRLLRNEIQIAHQAATDQIYGAMPWVEFEQIFLSPDHPDIGCECEEIVAGGTEGDGTYPKGTILLPIHVQCLCYKSGVMMDPVKMAKRLKGWVNGTGAWPAMDQFAQWWAMPTRSLPFTPTDDAEEDELGAAETAWVENKTSSLDLEMIQEILANGTQAEISDLISEIDV